MNEQSIDQILKLLKDGQWHDRYEIAEGTNLSVPKIQLVTDFLAKYNFVELDSENRRIRLSRSLTQFLRKISSVEAEKVC